MGWRIGACRGLVRHDHAATSRDQEEGRTRRARVNVFVHLVWATWDRLPLLTEAIERDVHRAIAAKCVALGAELIAYGGVADHVYALVRLPPTLTIADLVGQIKGASAHLVTHWLSPPNRFFKWQGAHGTFSISPPHLDRVCDYIKHQRDHHSAGTIIPRLRARSGWTCLMTVVPHLAPLLGPARHRAGTLAPSPRPTSQAAPAEHVTRASSQAA